MVTPVAGSEKGVATSCAAGAALGAQRVAAAVGRDVNVMQTGPRTQGAVVAAGAAAGARAVPVQ